MLQGSFILIHAESHALYMQAGNPTRDPRFISPPGGIGYAPAAAANAAAQEMLKARASMWQSSNNAVGGIGNAASFRQEQKR